MNPVVNPVTIGFLLAAGVGYVLGAAFGLIEAQYRWRVCLNAISGLGVVYLVGWFVCWPVLFILPIWNAQNGPVMNAQFWWEVLTLGQGFTLIGMLTAVPAFLLGFYKGRLKRRAVSSSGTEAMG